MFHLTAPAALSGWLTGMCHLLTVRATGHLSPWAGTAVVLFVAFLISRVGSGLLRQSTNVDVARNIRVGRRYALALVLVLGLYFVWAAEFHRLIYAFAAVLASVILVTKEVLSSFLGDAVKAYNRLCPVGTIVEIEGVRGEVVDSGMLTTTLQVIQNDYFHSARIVKIPNSVFLTKSVVQESKTGNYSVIFVRIPVSVSSDVGKAVIRLQSILEDVTAPYQAEAEAGLKNIHASQLLDFPSVAPRVLLEPTSADEVKLVGRFAAPTLSQGSVEQDVLKRFYARPLTKN
jgi:small-conductance mechanosensitive channel